MLDLRISMNPGDESSAPRACNQQVDSSVISNNPWEKLLALETDWASSNARITGHLMSGAFPSVR